MMSGEYALLAPLDRNDAVELSKTLWRKQLLPKGTIDYKGRKITFDERYLTDLADSFRSQAFDQVAFLLAKDDNSHTMDPERFRGEVRGVELTPLGLDVLLDLTPEASDLVRKNPRLGVSARIIESLERSDGRKFPRAIQHVLGTLDPRVTGMASWQEVTLSEEVTSTIDVTNKEVKVPTPQTVVDAPPPNTVPGAPTQEEIDALEQDAIEDEEELKKEVAASGANLSVSNEGAIELTGSVDLAMQHRIETLELDLARQKFANEMRTWVDKGVPPAIVMLAKPILELPQAPVIDLSNHGGDKIDVASVIRNMLHETEGFIELTTMRGSAEGFDSEANEDQRVDALLDAWAKQ
jgi:hypothetical protein